MRHSAVAGFGLGFFIAAQVGPIWLLSARTVLRGARRSGIAIGAAAALVDVAYAGLGVAGASRLLEIDALHVIFGLLGAGVLLFLGGRNLYHAFRIRAGGETDDEVLAPAAAFRTTIVAMASNPQTIAYWAAVFGAASAGDVTESGGAAIAVFLAAIACGTFAWNVILTISMTLIGSRLPRRALQIADATAGLGICGFGLILGIRSVRD